MKRPALLIATISCFLLIAPRLCADEAPLREQAAQALRKATDFFRKQVATEGGYLWRYSDDLARREGEGKATAQQVWVQPPGTPSVGMAYLGAYEATGDRNYLEAARETAHALVKGQQRSGGWDYRIEFDPEQRKRYAYRVEAEQKSQRNLTTLDDNTTQSAVRLLMRVDMALEQKDAKIHEAAEYALRCLLQAQYPNGGWPQRYDNFPNPADYPVKKANYPAAWSRTFPGQDYRGYYTLNDNSLADVIDVMLEAERHYREPRYRAAAKKGGDFLLLAQMPEPQPAWAQQYNLDMQPAWARKFEPPSITGGESQGALQTLMRLYQETGDRKYLEPVPRAIDYLRRSKLPDGRLARFNELQTNRPLYFTKDYQLTYSDDDMPTHYAFKISSRVDRIAQEYERLLKLDPAKLRQPAGRSRPRLSEGLTAQVKEVIARLDERGRWVTDGRLRNHGPDDPTRRVIDCRTFIQNVGVLSNYLAATKP